MKKRLISLLLAFSMMLTFLPAGAVSAFAEETADDTTKGELLTDGKTITESGTYQLNGPYTKGITINTEGPVEINVTGNVTVDFPENNNNYYFITIKKAGSVTFNGDVQYPVIVNGGSVILNKGENLIVNGGKYICNVRNPYSSAFTLSNGINQVENVTIESKYDAIDVTYNCDSAVIRNSNITAGNSGGFYEGCIGCRTTNGTLELDHVTVHALKGTALGLSCGTITIKDGEYTSDAGHAIRTYPENNDAIDLTITGGTYKSETQYATAVLKCYGTKGPKKSNVKINGSTFIGGQLLWFDSEGAETLTIDGNTTLQSIGGTYDAVVVGHGQLIFNSGTIEVSGGSERAALRTFDTGEAIVNDGTFKGAKYGIYERNDNRRVSPCRVQLKNATFDDTVCNVYLEANRQIDVDPAYIGQVSIECADPSDGRQLTKATAPKGQEKLNLTSANEGYLVGYKKTEGGQEYRCLSKTVGVTINGLKSEIKAEDTAEFTVTLTHENSTGTGILTFGDKNSEIEYKDKNGAYQPMPKDGLEVDLSGDKNDYVFHITPKNAGEQTLTAAVVRDAVEVGKDSETYHVAGRVHTTVTIEGLEDAVIKEGESKDFTVKVTPNDDAKLGEAFIDFGDKNSEIEYQDKNGEYKPMPEGGLPIDLGDVEEPYAFRITPKETGKQTLTAAVKQGENKLATDEKDFVVSEMPILTLKDGVITSVTVPGKNGADPEDITEIVKKNANEDGSFHVPEGATVSVAFDKDAFADSGLKFGHWDITGLDDPRSHRLTALSVTCSCWASSACVNPCDLRIWARNAPNVFASIVLTSFGKRIAYHAPKGNRRFVYLLQNTNPPPPVRSMDRQRGIFYMEFRRKMLGSELTAGGQQKPEPCRARYPRTS